MVDVIKNSYDRGVDALIFPSNVLTVKGLTAINSLGYKIPDDFGVVGFDQGDNAEIYSPKLTYVYQPTELVAKQSFEMLHKMINEEEVSLSKTVASKFVLGMSSGSSKTQRRILYCCADPPLMILVGGPLIPSLWMSWVQVICLPTDSGIL